jgi:hypothetical protein
MPDSGGIRQTKRPGDSSREHVLFFLSTLNTIQTGDEQRRGRPGASSFFYGVRKNAAQMPGK